MFGSKLQFLRSFQRSVISEDLSETLGLSKPFGPRALSAPSPSQSVPPLSILSAVSSLSLRPNVTRIKNHDPWMRHFSRSASDFL